MRDVGDRDTRGEPDVTYPHEDECRSVGHLGTRGEMGPGVRGGAEEPIKPTES